MLKHWSFGRHQRGKELRHSKFRVDQKLTTPDPSIKDNFYQRGVF